MQTRIEYYNKVLQRRHTQLFIEALRQDFHLRKNRSDILSKLGLTFIEFETEFSGISFPDITLVGRLLDLLGYELKIVQLEPYEEYYDESF